MLSDDGIASGRCLLLGFVLGVMRALHCACRCQSELAYAVHSTCALGVVQVLEVFCKDMRLSTLADRAATLQAAQLATVDASHSGSTGMRTPDRRRREADTEDLMTAIAQALDQVCWIVVGLDVSPWPCAHNVCVVCVRC